MFEYFLTFIVSIILICAAIGWAFVFALGIPQYLKFYFFFLKNKETENIIPIPKLYESNKINYIISMIIGLLIIIMGFFMQILYPPIFTVFGVAIIVLNLDLLIGSIIGTRPLLNLKIFAIPMNSFIKFIFRLIKGSSIFSVFLSCFGLVIIIFKYIFNVNIIEDRKSVV